MSDPAPAAPDSAQPAAPILDLAFPVVEGRFVAIDHAHALYGAIKHTAPQLCEWKLGVFPLRGQPMGELLQLRHHEHLRLRLPATAIAVALPLAGRDLRVGSMLLRLGVPRIEALEPHAELYARTVCLAITQPTAPNQPKPRHPRAPTEAELIARLTAACNPGASVRILRCRSLRIHQAQISGYEVVVEGLDAATSLRLQAEGFGGRRAFGCGIFVKAGVRKTVTATVAEPESEAEGIGHA